MFELREAPKKAPPPRWLVVSGAVTGAFSLGLSIGKLLMGAKPTVDWTMPIGSFVMGLGWTIWFTILAIKRDPPANNGARDDRG